MTDEMIEAKKKEDYEDLYIRIRGKVNKWFAGGKLEKRTGRWTDHFLQYLLVLPDLVHLVIKLFFDRAVPNHFKGYLLMGLAYLVSPIDIIPDFIPVAGFVDDLLVQVIILNKIINSADDALLEKIDTYWAGKDDVFDKIKEIIALLNDMSSQVPKSLYNFIKKED